MARDNSRDNSRDNYSVTVTVKKIPCPQCGFPVMLVTPRGHTPYCPRCTKGESVEKQDQ